MTTYLNGLYRQSPALARIDHAADLLASGFPWQPRYRGDRAGRRRNWSELNQSPSGATKREITR